MANFYDETRIYAFRYFQEKLLEKPFFLGVNGISGEAEEGKLWSLSSNPVFCDVYDNTSFQDLVIFLLHVCHYNNDNEDDTNAKLFDQYLTVFSKILDRISSALDPGNYIELDNIMAMFSSINIMSDMTFKIRKFSLKVSCTDLVISVGLKLKELILALEKEPQKYFPTKPNLSKLFSAGLINMICHFNILVDIWKHSEYIDMINLPRRTKIVRPGTFIFQNDLRVIVDYYNARDTFFSLEFLNIEIKEEFIDVFLIFHCMRFNSLKMEEILSKAKWEKKTFQRVKHNPLLSKTNLANLKRMTKLRDNPEKVTVRFCRRIFNKFEKSYNNRRYLPVMPPEEVQFIFHFMTQFLNSLKIIHSLQVIHLQELVRVVLMKFGSILNGIRYHALEKAIGIETSVLLSKAFMEFISDPLIKTFLPGMSAEMMVVLIRINVHLSKDRDMACVQSDPHTDRVSVTVRDVKAIKNASKIPKSRKSRWRKLLGEQTTAEDFLQGYNGGECPICYEKMQDDDYSLLLCKHNVCQSCMKLLLEQPGTRKLCPVCRTPLCEYLPSRRIKRISTAFQQEES